MAAAFCCRAASSPISAAFGPNGETPIGFRGATAGLSPASAAVAGCATVLSADDIPRSLTSSSPPSSPAARGEGGRPVVALPALPGRVDAAAAAANGDTRRSRTSEGGGSAWCGGAPPPAAGCAGLGPAGGLGARGGLGGVAPAPGGFGCEGGVGGSLDCDDGGGGRAAADAAWPAGGGGSDGGGGVVALPATLTMSLSAAAFAFDLSSFFRPNPNKPRRFFSSAGGATAAVGVGATGGGGGVGCAEGAAADLVLPAAATAVPSGIDLSTPRRTCAGESGRAGEARRAAVTRRWTARERGTGHPDVCGRGRCARARQTRRCGMGGLTDDRAREGGRGMGGSLHARHGGERDRLCAPFPVRRVACAAHA